MEHCQKGSYLYSFAKILTSYLSKSKLFLSFEILNAAMPEMMETPITLRKEILITLDNVVKKWGRVYKCIALCLQSNFAERVWNPISTVCFTSYGSHARLGNPPLTVPRSDRDSILKMAKGVLIVRQGHAILERPIYTQCQGWTDEIRQLTVFE